MCIRDSGITWKPVLAACCYIILLCGEQFVIFGTGSGVCCHVKDSLRICYSISVYILNCIAVVVLVECIESSLCISIASVSYTHLADSVLQICGNEETFDLANLYRCCEIARELTRKDEWRVGRVIARPYIVMKKWEFKRTSNRHDYALKPTGRTVLNALKDAGLDVIGIGKIHDIFCGEGITKTYHSDSSVQGMQQAAEVCAEDFHGLCFVNLVDFDALWGHRRNPEGYGHEIEKFDKGLGTLQRCIRDSYSGSFQQFFVHSNASDIVQFCLHNGCSVDFSF